MVARASAQHGNWDPRGLEDPNTHTQDLDWASLLWSDDVREVALTDFGNVRAVEGDAVAYWNERRLAIKSRLSRYGEFPIEDNRGGRQGVCYSERRASGREEWQDPPTRY
ncbi:hypothetical protein FRB99_003911 [Tulasnella sp. 403]|nr:hypothetical protein FRB99_003911 [Tulasnella sp. 403]